MSDILPPGIADRDNLKELFPENCRGCLVANAVIGNLLRLEHDIDAKLFGVIAAQCVEGPTTIGICGTKKTVCSHPAAEDRTNPQQQVAQLEFALEASLE